MSTEINNHKKDEQITLTKSELIAYLTSEQPHLTETDVELAVNSILDRMSGALANGERIEIRGFGSMALRYRPPRIGRNPKTGEKVHVTEKYVPHFKPGANLRKRVDGGGKA